MESESRFLKGYNINDYERPSLTTDVAAFTIINKEDGSYRRNPESRLSVLLIKRGEHPFKGDWALPGGFLLPGETVEDCALREIKEETSITPVAILPVGVFSKPKRDPRGWIISNAFASIIGSENAKEAGNSDAEDAKWFELEFDEVKDSHYELTLTHGSICLKSSLTANKNALGRLEFKEAKAGGLAFDHAEIIATALTALRREAENIETLFGFLPEKFTLAELQKTQETIMNISYLTANFRRKIADFVEETDEYVTGAGHRPAKLYKRR